MPITVNIPTPLRQFLDGQATFTIHAATNVADLLDQISSLNDDLRKHLLTADGKVPGYVNVYVNEEDVRFLDGTETALKDGDSVAIVPAIAGGCTRTGCMD